MYAHIPAIGRFRLFAITLFFVLAGSLYVQPATAAFKGCRFDPVVVLSDGTVLDIQAEVSTDIGNVREINYTLRAPRGVTVVAVISTPTPGFTGKETFTYYDDAKPYEYITETLVRTSDGRVPVKSYTTFGANSLLDGGSLLSAQLRIVEGYSDQVLRAVLKG